MGHINRSFLLLCTVLLLTGCSKGTGRNFGKPSNYTYAELNFKIERDIEQKARIDSADVSLYHILWESDDSVALFYDGYSSFSENFTVENSGQSARFTASFPDTERSSNDLFAFYPYSSSLNYDSSDNIVCFTLPSLQSPSPEAPVDSAIFLWATTSVTNEKENISLNFKNVNAYGCISIPKDLSVCKASITADVPLSGDCLFSFDSGQVIYKNTSNSVDLELSEINGELWFSCLPTESMKKLSVNLLLNDGRILRRDIDTKGNQFERAKVSRCKIDFSDKDEAVYYSIYENADPTVSDFQKCMLLSNQYYILQRYDEEYDETTFIFDKMYSGDDKSSVVIANFDKDGYLSSVISESFYAETFKLDNGNYDVMIYCEEGEYLYSDCDLNIKVKDLMPQTKAAIGVSHTSFLSAACIANGIIGLPQAAASLASLKDVTYSMTNIAGVGTSVGGLFCADECTAFQLQMAGLGLAGFAALIAPPGMAAVAAAGLVLSGLSFLEYVANSWNKYIYHKYLGDCVPVTLDWEKLEDNNCKIGIIVNGAESIPSEYVGKNIGGVLLKKYKGVSTGMNIYSRSDDTTVPLSFSITKSETRTTTVEAEEGYKYKYQAFITPYSETRNFDTSDGNFTPKKRRSLLSKTYYGQELEFSIEDDVREYLTKFYISTNGDNWTRNDKWCTDNPVNSWYGVQYSGGKLSISLPDNNLCGNGDISGCKYLTALRCKQNIGLTGLDMHDCKNVEICYCSESGITSLDVSGCDNLGILYCEYCKLSFLDIHGLKQLREVWCNHNNPLINIYAKDCISLWTFCWRENSVNALDVSGCVSLSNIFQQDYYLGSLNVSGCTGIDRLTCSHCQTTKLIVKNCPKLLSIDCQNNNLTSLDISGCPELLYINCQYNELYKLNLKDCPKFSRLDANDNSLQKLDLNGLSHLSHLYVTNNDLSELNINGCLELQSISCQNNNLTSLNTSGLTQLEAINALNNNISSLDLSLCYNLDWLNCDNNNLASLDISNCSCYGPFTVKGNPVKAIYLPSSFPGSYSVDHYWVTLYTYVKDNKLYYHGYMGPPVYQNGKRINTEYDTTNP